MRRNILLIRGNTAWFGRLTVNLANDEIKRQLIDICFSSPIDVVAFESEADYEMHKAVYQELISELYRMGVAIFIPGDAELPDLHKNKRCMNGQHGTMTFIGNKSKIGRISTRCVDVIGGLIGSFTAVILIVLLWLPIQIISPGPVLYTQTRMGLHGRKFKIYKIRSMRLDADKELEKLLQQNEMNKYMFKIKDDPRVIPIIGKFIRKTSIDEFPQFFNVLKGDMSIVGSRPPLPDEFEHYKPEYKVRLAEKPGITGMWQTGGRNDMTDFDEIVAMERDYIEHWSFAREIGCILKTCKMIFIGENGAY